MVEDLLLLLLLLNCIELNSYNVIRIQKLTLSLLFKANKF
jgi:hypothetical protein